jgi:hypothetical protein
MSMKVRKPVVILILFLIVVPNIFISLSTDRSRGGDFRGFLIAGDRLLHGRFLYEDSRVGTNVTWPPFFAVFIIPFVLLARINLPFTQMIWYILNIVFFFISVHLWCLSAYGKPLGGFDEKKELSFYDARVILPILLTADPLFRNFVQLQINPLILFLLSMGFFDMKREKFVLGGFWFGAATALKAYPLIVLPYLLFRKKIKAAAVMTLTVIALTLTPALRYGWTPFLANIKTWVGLSLSGGYPLGSLNQSVYAMTARWIASDPFLLMIRKLPSPPADDPGILLSTWIYRALLLLFFAAFLYLIRRGRFQDTAAEGATLITLGMVFSPIAWKHYWVLIFPACFVAYRAVTLHPSQPVRITFWGSALLITGLNLLGRFYRVAGSFSHCVLSSMTLGALLLLGSLLFIIGTREEARPVPSLSLRNKDLTA